MLFRYSDVLLMQAEAQLRNGDNEELLLNLVRFRVDAPFVEVNLENVLNERYIELAWEAGAATT